MTRRLLSLVLLAAAAPATSQTFELERSVSAGGGEVFAESPDRRWQLSGTLGQWEPSSQPAEGGGWRLLGGFWLPAAGESAGRLFRNGFEPLPEIVEAPAPS